MEVQLKMDIPDSIARELEQESGGDMSRLALEALALVGYCEEALSLGQVAELLGLSVYEADGFLKRHGVGSLITKDEIEAQRRTIDHLPGE
jgi:predicted HTH domain antitoxin